MTTKIFFQAISKFFSGVILVGLLLFLSAGTLSFFNAWLLMGILFVPMFFTGIVLMIKKPELLKKRLNAKETQREQKLVIFLSGLIFSTGFIVSGLAFRFRWPTLPKDIVLVFAFVFLIGYILYAEVIRENRYLSRTIEVCENQKVVDTGLYGIVRHPMYSASLLLFLSMPLILGSIYAFLIFLFYPFVIVKRIKTEEEFLKKELGGYEDYIQRVKYRLIPLVW